MKNRVLLVSLAVMLALSVGLTGCGGEQAPEITKYLLYISSTQGGSVTTPGEGNSIYDEGEVVNLVAEAEEGYRFVGWSGDVDSVDDANEASTTIVMNDDHEITADFEAIPPIQYKLIIASTEGGSVTSPGEGTFTYNAATAVSLVAEADDDYKFLNWTGDIETIGNVTAASTTITMEDDYLVTGNFTLEYIHFDKIGPGAWSLDLNAEGINATVTGEGLLVDIASDAFGTAQTDSGCFGRSLYTLEGDFDIRTEYELVTWPEQSGVRVGLIVKVPNTADKVNVERTGFGNPAHDIPHPSREVYLVNFNEIVHGIVGTLDLSGTLRVCRVGTRVTGYYGTPDGWEEIYQAQWSTEDVEVQVGVWTPGVKFFCGEEVSVLMRTVEIVEPAL